MKIYAHRGASYDYPEMTMAAFEEAVKQGADGVECDLRLSKDGVAVLWHDTDLHRIK
jgi:glycerophosphoryl diester phosphodiesterase